MAESDRQDGWKAARSWSGATPLENLTTLQIRALTPKGEGAEDWFFGFLEAQVELTWDDWTDEQRNERRQRALEAEEDDL